MNADYPHSKGDMKWGEYQKQTDLKDFDNKTQKSYFFKRNVCC